jgi:nucleoside-diphosphate-sugar epimerase
VTIRNVLITGATGFVGSHVVEALAGRIDQLRALVRPTSDTARLRALGIALETATFENGPALRRAVQGAEVIVHLAALTHAGTSAELDRVNVDGTRALRDAALEAEPRPRRIVYMSSLAAVGPSDGRPVGRAHEPRPLTAYGRSKLAGERVLLEAADRLEVVILRAPAVYGPRDAEMLRFFRMAGRGVLPVPGGPDRPLQLVHVEDLARAVVAAVLAPAAEGVYHVADAEALSWADVCRLLGRATGRRVRLLRVPPAAIGAAAAVSEAGARLLGGSSIFNRDKARELLASGWLCDTEDARRELGFETRIPLADGLRRTWEWYRNEGWL